MSTNVEDLIKSFLAPPVGQSPEDIKSRILRWADIANHPEKHVTDPANQYAVAARRRTARQNFRKLARRHPELAVQAKAESQEAA